MAPGTRRAKVGWGVLILLAAGLLYVLAVGLTATPGGKLYQAPEPEVSVGDPDRAAIFADAVTHALEAELDSWWGWIPNDLCGVPRILDNITAYQRGVIYATRPASDIVAKTAARRGPSDTLDKRLVDATSRDFTYSEGVWGGWFFYDCEGKYRSGIKSWRKWAADVGAPGGSAIYNFKSDDVHAVLRYCLAMTDYALGILNKENVGHFECDDNVYFAKGICAVVHNVLLAAVTADVSVGERGGADNVATALKRLRYINEFSPWYVVAGGNLRGDAMLPNHVAALARHVDVAGNRIKDIMTAMEK